MSKCALPAKREGHQNGTILQTQEGSSVSRNGRKILPAFLLAVFVAALATAAMPQKKEKAPNILRHRSKRNLTKKPSGRCGVRTVKGEASSRPCMPQSECGAGHAGQAYHRSVAGRITGHWRSLPQPSSAAWCPPPLHWSRAYSPHVASY